MSFEKKRGVSYEQTAFRRTSWLSSNLPEFNFKSAFCFTRRRKGIHATAQKDFVVFFFSHEVTKDTKKHKGKIVSGFVCGSYCDFFTQSHKGKTRQGAKRFRGKVLSFVAYWLLYSATKFCLKFLLKNIPTDNAIKSLSHFCCFPGNTVSIFPLISFNKNLPFSF